MQVNDMRNVITKSAAFFGLVMLSSVFIAGSRAAGSAPDTKLIETGRTLWLTAGGIGCAGCHGRYGEGDVGIGPYNRGVGMSKIQAAIAAVDQMRMIKDALSAQDIEAVGTYNAWLGQLQLVKTLVKLGRFVPNTVDIYPGTAVQLAINNTSPSPKTFAGPSMQIAEFKVPGKGPYDFVWHAPDREGKYTLQCVDCTGQDKEFTINVTRSAKPYRIPDASIK